MQPERLTCRDLALGVVDLEDACMAHDPERQTADSEHCACWQEPHPDDWCGGVTSPRDLPDHLIEQRCWLLLRVPVEVMGEPVDIALCCSCQAGIREEIGGLPEPADLRWTLWAGEALDWRDRRRTDSAPVPADMDMESGYLELEVTR